MALRPSSCAGIFTLETVWLFQFVGIQEVHIFVDTIHSQLGYKNSDVIPRKATCFMMLFSVPIALLERGNEGQLGSHVALQFFLVGTSASG